MRHSDYTCEPSWKNQKSANLVAWYFGLRADLSDIFDLLQALGFADDHAAFVQRFLGISENEYSRVIDGTRWLSAVAMENLQQSIGIAVATIKQERMNAATPPQKKISDLRWEMVLQADLLAHTLGKNFCDKSLK